MQTDTISVRVPKEVKDRLEEIARKQGSWSTSDLIKSWIKEKMEEVEDENSES